MLCEGAHTCALASVYACVCTLVYVMPKHMRVCALARVNLYVFTVCFQMLLPPLIDQSDLLRHYGKVLIQCSLLIDHFAK